MKTNIVLIIAVISLFSVSAFAQLKVNSDGKVGIGMDPNFSYFLQVTGTSGNSGLYTTTPSSTPGNSVYGISGNVSFSTNGSSINRGVYGSVYSATVAQSGQAIGVTGIAGNCTDGYNQGVFGNLLGTKSGAAVYGTVGTYIMPPAELTNPNAQYAGYFVGKVKIAGELWTTSGTVTGSDERIKKDITVLDSSDNIFKLLPKQYRLKTPSELLSGQKLTSDTAKVVLDNLPESKDADKYHYGFLAQDLQLVYPDLVYSSADGTLGIDYQGLIPMIIDQLKKMKQSLKEKDDQIISLQDGLEKCCGLSSLKGASIPNGTTITDNQARLNQNIPNPFSKETRIGCFIPEGSGSSVLYIYNMNGKQLQQYSISGLGEQSVTISGNSFDAGMYLYALVIDGKEVDTKRMILTK
ncbi:MAG TPA: tail fiber domain-containing protein [Prolixibacteraceae bacterium]|jgi:hypothetical protein